VLLRLSIQGRAAEVPALVRIQAGMVLGTLCYGSMLALCQGLPAQLPDSRLPLVVLGPGIAHSEGWRQALDSYWCQIKPGLFWSGDDIKRKPLRSSLKRVQLFHTYSIGRFPITNADFARFVAIGGYREPHWWGEYGWNWRLSAGCSHQPLEEPSINDLSGFNNPIQPIVGVSWYEATAYCTWLTELGYIQGWLHPSDVIRLPMALERERAARGTDQRIYPWGDAVPDSEHANYNETCVGQSSPVGCFVAGQSACGAFDMAGNVWEWTATSMGNPQSVQPVADLPPDRGILISGAPFHSSNRKLYCGARYWYAPYNQRSDIGFRVVCSPRLVKDFLVVNSSS
jgi:formylglycine-generating enzyme required for sulfatase activity